MNDNIEVPNAALREHVTDASFVLSLRKTHIAMLIAVANNDRLSLARDWITPAHGLKRRGLMFHCLDVYPRREGEHQTFFEEAPGDFKPLNAIYRLTRAGWAVYDLLVEAGMADAIDATERKVA